MIEHDIEQLRETLLELECELQSRPALRAQLQPVIGDSLIEFCRTATRADYERVMRILSSKLAGVES